MTWTFLARWAAVIVAAIGFSLPLAASPVSPSFSLSPTSILPSEKAGLDLKLSLSPDAGSSFFDGFVHFDLGDGTPTQTFLIDPGGTFKNFDFLHAYIDLGSYLVSYSASGTFVADLSSEIARAGCTRAEIRRISNRNSRRHRQISCRRNPTVTFVSSVSKAWEAHGSESLTVEALATPLPGALPLFASGAALLGWWARRRRNNASAGLSSS